MCFFFFERSMYVLSSVSWSVYQYHYSASQENIFGFVIGTKPRFTQWERIEKFFFFFGWEIERLDNCYNLQGSGMSTYLLSCPIIIINNIGFELMTFVDYHTNKIVILLIIK